MASTFSSLAGAIGRLKVARQMVNAMESDPSIDTSTKEDLQSIDALIDEALDDMAKAIEAMKTTR